MRLVGNPDWRSCRKMERPLARAIYQRPLLSGWLLRKKLGVEYLSSYLRLVRKFSRSSGQGEVENPSVHEKGEKCWQVCTLQLWEWGGQLERWVKHAQGEQMFDRRCDVLIYLEKKFGSSSKSVFSTNNPSRLSRCSSVARRI